MAFKGIIFDFNGVLLWDAHLHEQAWQRAAHTLRGSAMNENELAHHVHGRTNSHILGYLTGRNLHGAELHELTQAKESFYRDLCLASGAAFCLSPGTENLLDYLVTQRIPRTIATASEKTNLNFFVKHLRLEKWFALDRIVYDDGSFPGKPAPDMYLRGARNLDLAPKDCIVVEDAFSGLQSAHAAGIGHIVALGPLARHAKLAAYAGVHRVIESFEHFPIQQLTAA